MKTVKAWAVIGPFGLLAHDGQHLVFRLKKEAEMALRDWIGDFPYQLKQCVVEVRVTPVERKRKAAK